MGTELLGHMPLDPQLSTLCDEGAIEVYHNAAFEKIIDQLHEQAAISEPEPL